MGVTLTAQVLISDLPLPRNFAVCELGNQYYATQTGKEPAEAFYRSLGCTRYETLDLNGRASVDVDLNYPLPHALRMKLGLFDLVTNFGTSEHCFNLAQVWQTIHELTGPGGYIALEQPTQGWVDHGFVNIQPTMIRDLARANDYVIEHLSTRKVKGHGRSLNAILRRTTASAFRFPQQGRYAKTLRGNGGRV